MLGFTPFKKHANKFNYVPRYYDPEKEAREQRRAELHGERSDQPEGEYRPGQYIRTQREARGSRTRSKAGRRKIWIYMGIAMLIVLFIQILYPRISALLNNMSRTETVDEQLRREYGDFDPTAPITIVPNDYVEETEAAPAAAEPTAAAEEE